MLKFFVLATSFIGCAFAGQVRADVQLNFDGETEGFKGTSWTTQGVTFSNVNTQVGVFPDGSTFTQDDVGSQVIIEQADLAYDGFPDYGSPNNSLNFGSAYINGANLTIGAMSTVDIDLPSPASSAGFEMIYYENGPWSGIVFHLDAYSGATLVGSSSFTIAGEDLNARDNAAINTLAVQASSFDSLKFYATFGSEFSAPRAMIDDFYAISVVPEPTSLSLLAATSLMLSRRQRGHNA